MHGAVVELTEIARTLDRYAETARSRSGTARALEQRVTLLETLKRKYGATIAEVIAFGELAARTDAQNRRSRRGTGAAGGRDQSGRWRARSDGEGACAKCGRKRPRNLTATVARNLADLGFRQANFEASLTRSTKSRDFSGTDAVELLFSPESRRTAQAAALRSLRAAKSRA